MPAARPLQSRLREIGRQEHHSLAKTAELLLLRGLAAYETDGRLTP